MKCVEQTLYGIGTGNCFSASIASILEISIEDVPNFAGEPGADDGTWFIKFIKWCEDRGLGVVSVDWDKEDNLVIHNAYCIVCGDNHNGLPHAIVGKSRYNGSTLDSDGNQRFEYDIIHEWDPNQKTANQGLSEVHVVIFLLPGSNIKKI